MLDEKHMVIVNEEGEEIEVEIILTFENPEGTKNFVLIADPDDPDTVYPFLYTDEGDLEEVTDPDDFAMCEEVYSAFDTEAEEAESGDEL